MACQKHFQNQSYSPLVSIAPPSILETPRMEDLKQLKELLAVIAEVEGDSYFVKIMFAYQAAQLGVAGVELFLRSNLAKDWDEQEMVFLTDLLAAGCRQKKRDAANPPPPTLRTAKSSLFGGVSQTLFAT